MKYAGEEKGVEEMVLITQHGGNMCRKRDAIHLKKEVMTRKRSEMEENWMEKEWFLPLMLVLSFSQGFFQTLKNLPTLLSLIHI